MEDAFILSAVRTPIGSLNGALGNYTAPQLGAKALSGALAKAGVKGEELGEVVMGNVVSAGVGQAPARQASILAGIPPAVGATTVNKVCGSGMKAVMLAGQSLRLGEEDLAAAGGMESMTKAPFLVEKLRAGHRYGNTVLADAILKDGLIDPYSGVHMGDCGEACAEKYAITRAQQDDFATRSYKLALEAQNSGAFKEEIVEIDGIILDEEPARGKPERRRGSNPLSRKAGRSPPSTPPRSTTGPPL